MVYGDFIEFVRKEVSHGLGGDHNIMIRQVPKNNGICLDGICISRCNDRLSPTIYLDSYFEQYQEQRMTLDEIIDDIIAVYHENQDFPALNINHFMDFSIISEKIAFKLVESSANTELLKELPHIPFLDLAMVFYLFIDESPKGQMTSLIYYDHMELWDLNTEQLCEIAKNNTPLLFPAHIRDMTEVLKEIAKANLGEDYREEWMDELFAAAPGQFPLYVLGNQRGIHGASCILYPDVLKNFAHQLNQDLIILPSSIHEVLLVPDAPGLSYCELQSMVRYINRSEVPKEDRLSDQIYRYQRSSDTIQLISPDQNTKEPI